MVWDNDLLSLATTLRNKGLTWKDTAEILSEDIEETITENAVRKAVIRHTTSIPEPLQHPVEKLLTIPDQNVLVLYDIHAGYHNAALIEQAIRLARLADIKTLITDADLFDFSSISTYLKDPHEISLNDELTHDGDMLATLGSHFETIYMINANHYNRISIRLQQPLDLKHVINMCLAGRKANIVTTNREYMLMGDNFLFAHPSKSGASGKVNAAMALAAKYHRHTLTGHTHRSGFSNVGNYLALEVGCCLDQERAWYKMQGANKFSPFALGFAMILDGHVLHFDEHGNTSLNGTKKGFVWWENYFS